MARTSSELTDAQWAVIGPLLPTSAGKRGRPFRDTRQVVEGIICRFRTGVPWRDVPDKYGPWQTLWKRHARFSRDGTWERVWHELMARADAEGEIDWMVSADSSSVRVHQHGATAKRHEVVDGDRELVDQPDGVLTLEDVVPVEQHTGGWVESQGNACRPSVFA